MLGNVIRFLQRLLRFFTGRTIDDILNIFEKMLEALDKLIGSKQLEISDNQEVIRGAHERVQNLTAEVLRANRVSDRLRDLLELP